MATGRPAAQDIKELELNSETMRALVDQAMDRMEAAMEDIRGAAQELLTSM